MPLATPSSRKQRPTSSKPIHQRTTTHDHRA
jgi:hypothetical protein